MLIRAKGIAYTYSTILILKFNIPKDMSQVRTRECEVCLDPKIVFKKMHENNAPQPSHYMCLDCYKEWKLHCRDLRKDKPWNKQLTCHLCARDDCYTLSGSYYVMCHVCADLRKTYEWGCGYHMKTRLFFLFPPC